MTEQRSISVTSLTMPDEEAFLRHLGFQPEDTHHNDDGSINCEITHGCYRVEAMSTGDGHVLVHAGPVAPKSMGGMHTELAIEVRNGHNLAGKLKIDPPEQWIVSAVSIGEDHHRLPNGEMSTSVIQRLRETIANLYENKEEFRMQSRVARARRNRPGPR